MSNYTRRKLFTASLYALGILSFVVALCVRHLETLMLILAVFSYFAGVLIARYAYNHCKFSNFIQGYFGHRYEVSSEPSDLAVYIVRGCGYFLAVFGLCLFMFS